jgi:hypothetical protein
LSWLLSNRPAIDDSYLHAHFLSAVRSLPLLFYSLAFRTHDPSGSRVFLSCSSIYTIRCHYTQSSTALYSNLTRYAPSRLRRLVYEPFFFDDEDILDIISRSASSDSSDEEEGPAESSEHDSGNRGGPGGDADISDGNSVYSSEAQSSASYMQRRVLGRLAAMTRWHC